MPVIPILVRFAGYARGRKAFVSNIILANKNVTYRGAPRSSGNAAQAVEHKSTSPQIQNEREKKCAICSLIQAFTNLHPTGDEMTQYRTSTIVLASCTQRIVKLLAKAPVGVLSGHFNHRLASHACKGNICNKLLTRHKFVIILNINLLSECYPVLIDSPRIQRIGHFWGAHVAIISHVVIHQLLPTFVLKLWSNLDSNGPNRFCLQLWVKEAHSL